MKKNLAIFFLTCSFAVVLVHSILPHSHLKDQFSKTEISTVKPPSLVDIVKRSLAQDLGSKHLEDYKDYNVSYFLDLDATCIAILEVIESTDLIKDANYIDSVIKSVFSYYISTSGLRAPPKIS